MDTKLPFLVVVLLMLLESSFMQFARGRSSWKYCGDNSRDYRVKVLQDVIVRPDPVIRGNDAVFEIPAITSKIINDGNVVIDVYSLGVRIYRETDDLCGMTECPVGLGEFSLSNSLDFRALKRTGSYRLDMMLLDEDDSLLTCIRINFRIVRSSFLVQ